MGSILSYSAAFADVVYVPQPKMFGLTLVLCAAGLVFVVVVLTVAIIRYNWKKKSADKVSTEDNVDIKD